MVPSRVARIGSDGMYSDVTVYSVCSSISYGIAAALAWHICIKVICRYQAAYKASAAAYVKRNSVARKPAMAENIEVTAIAWRSSVIHQRNQRNGVRRRK